MITNQKVYTDAILEWSIKTPNRKRDVTLSYLTKHMSEKQLEAREWFNKLGENAIMPGTLSYGIIKLKVHYGLYLHYQDGRFIKALENDKGKLGLRQIEVPHTLEGLTKIMDESYGQMHLTRLREQISKSVENPDYVIAFQDFLNIK